MSCLLTVALPLQVPHALEDGSNKVPAVSFNHRQIQSAASSWRQELFRGPWTFLCAWGLTHKQDQTWPHRAGGRFCRNITHQPVCAEEQAPQSRSVSSSCIKGLWYFALWGVSHSPLFFRFPSLRKDKGYVSVLLPVSKLPGVGKMVHPRVDTQKQLQDKHVRHQQSGPGRRAMTAPRALSLRRASQSAVL